MKGILIIFSFISLVAADDDAVKSMMRSLRSRSVGTSEVSPWHFEAVKLSMRAECGIFGTNESFSVLETTLGDSKACLRQAITSSMKPQKAKDLRIVIKQFCSLSPQLGQCLSRYSEAVAACGPPAERAPAAQFINSIFDYACADGRLTTLLAEGGLTCFREQKDELLQCVTQSYPDGAVTSSTLEKVCERRASLRNCIRGKLEKCSRPAALRFYDELVQARMNFSVCPTLAA